MSGSARATLTLLICVLGPAAPARADWLLIPFMGTTFAGQSPAVAPLDTEASSRKHWLFGGSAAWLTDNVLGLEADIAFVPGIFQSDNVLIPVEGSYAVTLGGNVILAVPLSITRDSLRPYLVGGLGLARFGLRDRLCLEECATFSEAALQVGGGAIGLVSDRAGIRFDLRQTRTLRREDSLLGDRRAKLSFWRATVGVVIRFR